MKPRWGWRDEASPAKRPTKVFAFFTEVGVISQLATARLAKALPDGVHPSHFAIVNHLARTGDGVSPVRIAAAMQVTKNTMPHSLKVLEKRGFITVAPSPDDGRAKIVLLTDAGRVFFVKRPSNKPSTCLVKPSATNIKP